MLFEWALAFLSVVVGDTGKGSVEVYGEFNLSDKREQRKLAYSAERRKGRMKSNQITKQLTHSVLYRIRGSGLR